MGLQIALRAYPGRGGASLPITLYYSSKVWRIKYTGTIYNPYDVSQSEPMAQAMYSEYSAAGWTSSLGVPILEWPESNQVYTYRGKSVCLDCHNPALSPDNYWKVPRLTIHMPDGSAHELRRDDTPYTGPVNNSGTYYSVDGSRLRYDTATATLYLPDGTRYVWGDGIVQLIDRNGNTLTYSTINGVWTDALGRTISAPPLTYYPGDFNYSLPGVGGSTLTYTFRWTYLGNVLEPDPETGVMPQLGYAGGHYLNGTPSFSNPPQPLPAPHLFETTENPVSTMNDYVIAPQSLFNPAVLSEIVLPNGTSYKFRYNQYGEIAKVIYPTGGFEQYKYGQVVTVSSMDAPYDQGNRGAISRWVSPSGTGNDRARWQYGITFDGNTNKYTAWAINPDNTYEERYLFKAPPVSNYTNLNYPKFGYEDPRNGMPYEERFYQYQNGPMLRRKLIDSTYSSRNVTVLFNGQTTTAPAMRNPRVTREIEILLDTGGDALAKSNTYQYDTTYQFDVGLEQTGVSQYDYTAVNQTTAQTAASSSIPTGALLITTQTAFLTGNASYRARNILGLPTSTTVLDGAGATVAQSTVSYDEGAYPLLTYGSVTGWIDPGTTVRGNATTTSKWLNTTGTYLQTHAQYDQCGSVRNTWDSKGNQSQVAYSSTYQYAYPTNTTTPVPDPSGVYGANFALTSSTAYDFSTGLVTSTTDPNGKVTSVYYDDPLNRPKTILKPDGGWTVYFYGDTPGSIYINTRSGLDPSRVLDSYQFFDGLGRPNRSFKNEAGTWLVSDTQYDSLGRVWRVSNPYRSTQGSEGPVNPSGNWTTTAYDALGRVISVTTPDGAQTVSSYSGNRTTVTDPAGKARSTLTDALGRLTQVIEAPNDANFNYQTSYTYDALGNLRSVTQDSQHRYFMYDSLSRLIRVKNPEQDANPSLALSDPLSGNSQWSVAYAYDSNGNLSSRTDARGLTTTYTYDNLNRNTVVSYSDGSHIDRVYDWATNGRGRLAYSAYYPTSGAYSLTAIDNYDAMGRPLYQRQHFNLGGSWGTAFVTQRTYDLAGNITSQTYPSGRVVNYTYDAAGRTYSVTGNLGDGVTRTYANSISYDQWGGLSREQFGTDTPLYHKEHRNIRGQLYDIRLSTVDDDLNWNRGVIVNYYSFQPYGFGTSGPDNNGNLLIQQSGVPADDAISSSTFMQQNYAYDSLNRITWVGEYLNGATHTGSQSYSYDRWGNRTLSGWFGAGIPGQFFSVDTNTNRLGVPAGQPGVMQYDANGNLTNDTYSGAGARTYDAENRMVAAINNSGQQSTYTYDADGRRVRRNSFNQETWQVYGIDGELLGEYAAYAAPSAPQKEYGYRGGELLVVAAPGADVRWLVSDQLGTPRIIADRTGSLPGIRRHDYLPFGEELFAGSGGRTAQQGYQGSDGVRQQFTGKERDNELGLDYFNARYYSSVQGRFTSVDPENYQAMRDLSDPQSWNAYTYVNNNPLRRTDPDGRGFWEKLKNLWNWGIWGSDEDVQRVEDKWRNWLRDREKDAGGTLVYCPGGCAPGSQAYKVNIDTLSRSEVFHYAASLKEALETGNIVTYSKEQIDKMAGLDNPIVMAAAAPIMNFSAQQLQKKFKHAGDFGVSGNYNSANAGKFQQAIEDHLADPDTKAISGTYRGQPVTHYVNPRTGINVMKDTSGNFLSGWKLSPGQLTNVLSRGKL